jgi:hypothetical protein
MAQLFAQFCTKKLCACTYYLNLAENGWATFGVFFPITSGHPAMPPRHFALRRLGSRADFESGVLQNLKHRWVRLLSF